MSTAQAPFERFKLDQTFDEITTLAFDTFRDESERMHVQYRDRCNMLRSLVFTVSEVDFQNRMIRGQTVHRHKTVNVFFDKEHTAAVLHLSM